jgi:uracil-DNA glycosylase
MMAATAATWATYLGSEKSKPYFKTLQAFLAQECAQGKTIYPQQSFWYQALKLTPFANTKVVILGQDPYHGAGQAHGLCFSVPQHQVMPPSLKNIFKELQRDLGQSVPEHGDLTAWAQQGVLLLNAVLTVRMQQAGSHANQGWEQFTDQIIRVLSQHQSFCVFLLWGRYAMNKRALIDQRKHMVLTSAHPSPLSAYRGFLGCGHFSKVNAILQERGLEPIQWCKQ